MVEPSDSYEVKTFMAAFQKLRSWIDNEPDELESGAIEDESLAKLCDDVFRAAEELRRTERSHRELFSAPTNPGFVSLWQEFDARYSGPVARVVVWFGFGILPGPAAKDAQEIMEGRWNRVKEAASSEAGAVTAAINHAQVDLDAFTGLGSYSEDYRNEVVRGIADWNSLVDEVGFDLDGVFRRRDFVPFVKIPRHVSNRHGANETLSLMNLLRQAQEAFIYGVPLAALALMRAILEMVLKEHYGATGKDLDELINKARRLPKTIQPRMLHRIRTLGNQVVHVNKEELKKLADIELEIVSSLLVVKLLIEEAPPIRRP